MVVVQVTIDNNEEEKKLVISCNLLRREDAKDMEYDIAKVFEEMTVNFSKDLANKMAWSLNQEFINDSEK